MLLVDFQNLLYKMPASEQGKAHMNENNEYLIGAYIT